MSKSASNITLPHLVGFLVVSPKSLPIHKHLEIAPIAIESQHLGDDVVGKIAKSEARVMRASTAGYPGSLRLSRSFLEVTHKLLHLIVAVPVMNTQEPKPWQCEQLLRLSDTQMNVYRLRIQS